MDYRINRLKLQANAGVRKHRAFKITKRWIESMACNELNAIQEESEHKSSSFESVEAAALAAAGPGASRGGSESPRVAKTSDSEACDESASYTSSSECGSEEEAEVHQLREWVLSNNIAEEQVDGLLAILRRRLLPSAPPTAEALLSLSAASSLRSDREPKANATLGTSLSEQDFRMFMLRNIAQISSDVAEMKRKTLAEYTLDLADFSKKYELNLPMGNVLEFDDFNKRIVKDKEFYTDLCVFLKSRVIVDNKISKILAPLLKIFLTRELALTCTTVKKVENRIIFTDTAFSQCLKQIIFESRQRYAAETTDSDFNNAIRSTLSNCRDWNGYRYQRNKTLGINQRALQKQRALENCAMTALPYTLPLPM